LGVGGSGSTERPPPYVGKALEKKTKQGEWDRENRKVFGGAKKGRRGNQTTSLVKNPKNPSNLEKKSMGGEAKV